MTADKGGIGNAFAVAPPYEAFLYPPLPARRSGWLPVGGLHEIYWEESGTPTGVPVLFLHGGPGGGCSSTHRRLFDPARTRIVLHDQRGAGRSRPYGEISENSTAHLIADIERLRAHLGIERWLVFGGSWGSTLGLAYGEAHPQRCLGFVLRGVFLGSKHEVDWFLHGMRSVFPEAWEAFVSHLPPDEHGDLVEGYHRRLTDPDPRVHLPAARAWSHYEAACSSLLPNPDLVQHFEEDRVALAIARIEAHYFRHHLFLGPGQLMDGLSTITHLPCAIVQGRYDMVCPIRTAWELHRRWPGSRYLPIADSGHSAWEPSTTRALVAETRAMVAARGLD